MAQMVHDNDGLRRNIEVLKRKLAEYDEDDRDLGLSDTDADDDPISVSETSDSGLTKKVRRIQILPLTSKSDEALANDLFLTEKFEEALIFYERIVNKVSGCSDVHWRLAQCYEKLGRPREEFLSVKTVVEIDPYHVAAWGRFIELAEAEDLNRPEEVLRGLKSVISINDTKLSPREKHPFMKKLVAILEENGDVDVWQYQFKLLQLELTFVEGSTCLELVTNIVKGCMGQRRGKKILGCLHDLIKFTMGLKEGVHHNVLVKAVAAYAEAVQLTEPAVLLKTLRSHSIIVTVPENTKIKTAERITVKKSWWHNLSLVASVCVAVMASDGQNVAAVELLIRKRFIICNETMFLDKDQLFNLCSGLLESGRTDLARDILEYYREASGIEGSAELLCLSGKVYEDLDDVPKAKAAYQQALTFRTYREARLRLCALNLDFPNPVSTRAKKHIESTVALQLHLFEKFTKAMEINDKAAVVAYAGDLLSSTFGWAARVDPGKFLFTLRTPFTFQHNLARYLVAVQVVSAEKLKVTDIFEVAMKGCTFAFNRKDYDALLNIAFHAMRTLDFHEYPVMLEKMKMAIIVATYYMGVANESPEHTEKLKFCLDYLREDINRSRRCSSFSVPVWNFYYQLLCNRDLITSPAVSKWCKHWMNTNGFSVEIQIILANDSMRRGSYIYAYKLLAEILNHFEVKDVSWIVWMHLGVLSLNMACRFRLAYLERCRLYSLGMFYLEKYGQMRGSCPEVLFNKARATQQFGDTGMAIQFYEECLDMCSKTNIVDGRDDSEYRVVDLSFEAAYNLRALYIAQKRFDMVDTVIANYLTWDKLRSHRQLNGKPAGNAEYCHG